MNSVNEIGNLTADPELKYLPGKGTAVTTFTIAVNDSFKDHTNFFDVKAFGKTAENIAKFFEKGKPIGITGKFEQERWEAKDGGKRSKVAIICEQFSFIGKKE